MASAGVRAGNVNKLVAAIDAAEKEGVAEPLIAKARQQLRQKQLRRSGGQRHGSASSKVTKDRCVARTVCRTVQAARAAQCGSS